MTIICSVTNRQNDAVSVTSMKLIQLIPFNRRKLCNWYWPEMTEKKRNLVKLWWNNRYEFSINCYCFSYFTRQSAWEYVDDIDTLQKISTMSQEIMF